MATIVHITTVPETLFFLRGQIGYMKEKGFDLAVVSSPGELLYQFAEIENVPFYEVTLPRRITPLRDAAALAKLWFMFRRIRPQVVHCHTPKGGVLGIIAAYLARVPVRIYHVHGLPFVTATGFRRVLLRCTEKISSLLAHRVFCVARSTADLAVTEGISSERKIKVLGHGSINGVDAAIQFNPAGRAVSTERAPFRNLGIPPDALVLGFVGRIVVDKGIRELAEAWQELREEFEHLNLLLVGPVEPQDPVPADVVESFRNDRRVLMTGWMSDLAVAYTNIDVLVLPTYREGFPVVLLEAAAMQIPVVATRIPGCVDAVVDGVTGTLVPARDAHALAEAIRKYLRNPDLRRKHGQAGRDRVLRDFRPQAIWEALYREYLFLLNEKGVPLPSELLGEKTSTPATAKGGS